MRVPSGEHLNNRGKLRGAGERLRRGSNIQYPARNVQGRREAKGRQTATTPDFLGGYGTVWWLWGGLMTVPSKPTEGLQEARADQPARPSEALKASTFQAAGRPTVTQVGRVVRPAHNRAGLVLHLPTSERRAATTYNRRGSLRNWYSFLIVPRRRLPVCHL